MKKGTVVTILGSRQRMCIEYTSRKGDSFLCVWHDAYGLLHKEWFNQVVLAEHVEDGEPLLNPAPPEWPSLTDKPSGDVNTYVKMPDAGYSPPQEKEAYTPEPAKDEEPPPWDVDDEIPF